MKKKKNWIKLCTQDRIMYAFIAVIMVLVMIIIVYPLIFVISSSFSSGAAVTNGKVILLPVDFSLIGYKIVFAYRSVWTGYSNTVFYTVLGTALSVFLTTLTAYPLSRRRFRGKRLIMTLFMITMFFSGGIIPSYILMSNLHLTNSRLGILLSGAFSIHNMIVMRTFFQNSIPGELYEAAKIDGITDIGYLIKIVLPLSRAVLAVITLYYAVARWNSYFSAMLYLRKSELYPLQLVLRDILNSSKFDLSNVEDPELLAELEGATDVMKYALIVVSSLPVMILYPFVQKYFEKGVMIGSVKG